MLRIRTIAWVTWLEVLRRKDAYVLLILLGALLIMLVSLDIFGLGGVTRYVADIGLLMAWVFAWILAVSVGARQLPREESRGTVFSLLAKPVSRFEVVAGKWLGSWGIVSAATLCFYLLVVAVVIGKSGRLHPVAVVQGYLLHAVALGVMSAIAVAFSTRMNSDAASTLSYVLTGAAFLVVPRIPEFMLQTSRVRGSLLMFLYHALPHFEVFDMRKRIVQNYGPADWRVVALVALYGLLLAAVVVLIAWLAFRRKRFSRTQIG